MTSNAGCSIETATTREIAAFWAQRWGSPVITPRRDYRPEDVQGLIGRSPDDRMLGLVTWYATSTWAEIITLDALDENRGHGSLLLAAAERAVLRGGIDRVSLVTTNDNLRALGFYLRRGYRLIAVHLDAVDEARRRKPVIPRAGRGGVPMRDLWQLEKALEAGR